MMTVNQSINAGEGVWTMELSPSFWLCSGKKLLGQPTYYRWKDLIETLLSLF